MKQKAPVDISAGAFLFLLVFYSSASSESILIIIVPRETYSLCTSLNWSMSFSLSSFSVSKPQVLLNSFGFSYVPNNISRQTISPLYYVLFIFVIYAVCFWSLKNLLYPLRRFYIGVVKEFTQGPA
ncbi:MAG: hypothetical protein JNM51_15760 [Bacteroidia bacterium]|nr:hypothetical protein [Bacteroidia bacterium]